MIDAATLLCERCGYVVDGLPERGNCPECGMPIAESAPERRVGSAWQGERSRRSALATCAAMWRVPRRVFDGVRIEALRSGAGGRHLDLELQILAALLMVLPMAVVAAMELFLSGAEDTKGMWALLSVSAWLMLMGGPLMVIPAAFMFNVLTKIERAGIQFFGRQRRWRVTPVVAEVVCAHACAGWVAGACIGTVLLAVGAAGWFAGRGGALAHPSLLLMIGGECAGFAAGMLWFEILVYVGVRRCRYANQPRGEPDPVAERRAGGDARVWTGAGG